MEKFLFVSSARRFFEQNHHAFDLLHVHESHWLAGLGVELAGALGVPVLVKEALSPVLTPLIAGFPYPRRFDGLRRQAGYLALTPEIGLQLAERGVAKDRIFWVPNGVELPELTTNVAENSLVVCVANLWQGDYHKGFSTLLTSWQEVRKRQPSASLAVVGGGDVRPWKECAEKLGLGDSVRFPGKTEDVASWYRQAAAFVLPSRREGMSNALLEAQSWGIPAVVSDISGNRAVVEDGINGIVFPVGDAHRLAEGIISLLDSPSKRQRMGLAARQRMEKDFSVTVVASQLMKVYRDISSRGASLRR
jgi:glycosyltransferase involved in cell wall biosynthesis